MANLPSCCCQSDDEEASHAEQELHMLGDPSAMPHHDEGLPMKDYESLNYDQCPNVPYRTKIKSLSEKTFACQYLMRWVMVAAIGATTGFIAFLIDFIVRRLTQLKFNTVRDHLLVWAPQGNLILALLLLVAFNAAFALVAAILTAIEPVAAGSGIPEIKCYLNGVKVPHVARLRTLVSKAVGVLFSVAGGFFVGKEGPMIHTGAIVGSGLPQFQSIAFRFINFDYSYFRSDRDKRDFVSSGAAAGVAAAFGAPIGGVLFSLEEGSSFWNQALTWRTLFCSMVSTFTLNFFLSGTSEIGWGRLNEPSLIDFGEFECEFGHSCNLWTATDLVIFVAIGAIGGLLGAAFNTLNTILTRYRMKHVQRKGKIVKILEAILISMVTTTATFAALTMMGTCQPYVASVIPQDVELNNDTVTFFCPDGYFNDMATLFFNPQEAAIKEFFHQKATFSIPTLVCYLVMFFILACWTYGAGIPSGLFVPCIACGASYGRLVAEILVKVGYLNEANVSVGTYSLIGAAAFLGGVVRMTISLTVILMESTNNISYGVPIMITLMVAKWIGDLFNEGLYDIHIHLRAIPLLEWEAPDITHRMTASHIMSTRIKYLYPNTRVRSLVHMLRTTAHSAFPVITKHKRSTQLQELVSPPASSTSASADQDPGLAASTRTEYSKVRLRSNVNQNNPEYMALCRAHAMQHAPDLLSIRTSRMTFSMSHSGHVSRQASNNMSRQPSNESSSEPSPLGPSPMSSSTSSLHSDQHDMQGSETVLLFHGMVLRHHLVKLLKERLCVPEEEVEEQSKLSVLDYDKLLCDYPRFPDIHDITVASEDMDKIVDLTPYMNPCPYTVSALSPVPYVFNLFRTMGLRHLPVMDSMGQIVGVITRHNLTHAFLERCMERHGLSHD
ncbi:H(+)/Cl(-) exchange transporter 6-like [Sycon ciliatum]|uniref:H(+)/Cl(-) exchange transporter 6-like n=1 Tax=Sycon ciliatum TaxID=27933 RepID=UPI0031F6A55A